MKKALTVSGRVELTRQEISLAVQDWLARHHSLKMIKSIFVTNQHQLQGAVLEVRQEPREQLGINLSTKIWDNRPNTGIFTFLKNYLEQERNKKNKAVKFEELYGATHHQFPRVNQKRLRTYLYDRRQLPNITVNRDVIAIT